MNAEELRNAILADAEAKAMADAGNDAGCAVRMQDVLPLVRVDATYTSKGLYRQLGATVTEPILKKLETYDGQIKDIVARAVSWLTPAEGGLNFGDQQTLAFLNILHAEGKLEDSELAALNALSLDKPMISANQVSEAWLIFRPDGKIPGPEPIPDPAPEPEPTPEPA